MLPQHVAIIMDGNGRWAESRGRPRIYGHIHGSHKVRTVVKECRRLGIPYLTLYAFSSENWGRPKDEVQILMRLLCKFLVRELKTLLKENVRLNYIGEIDKLPQAARDLLVSTAQKTAHNTGLCLTFALSYGSRQEILNATKNIAADVLGGNLKPEQITETVFKEYLFTSEMPDPDLIIRTSGEMRLSNFLMWQAAYSELFVTEKFWPDFSADDFQEALNSYSNRKRRFGLTQQQLLEEAHD